MSERPIRPHEAEFNGDTVLVFDEQRTRIPLPPAQDGYKAILACCCDCGAVHVWSIGEDHAYAERATPEVADQVRRAVLAQDPSYFPMDAPPAAAGAEGRQEG